jgi:tRNA-2-methylthio-N6-dimethylallyladenosine synthase
MIKFFVKTYGCQMNVRDSGLVTALLIKHGHVPVDTEEEADLIVINTCSVRGKAEDKAIGKLGLMTATKKERPDRIIGAIGCMVQRLGEDIFNKVRSLDFAIGPNRITAIPGILDAVCAGQGPVFDVGLEKGSENELSAHSESGISAFVNILFGCNRRCTYCIVPSVRGAEWSRPAQSIVDEIKVLSDNGIKEVTLLGQSVMAYGQRNEVFSEEYISPKGYKEPLSRLLEAVNNIDGIKRIRFTSGHPSGCSEELAQAMMELPAVCEHMHLPVQSGSDPVLKRMRRGYTVEEYKAAVARLRYVMPDIAITSDVIVGFPGETGEDFEMTKTLMNEIGFNNAFIFKYSTRPGTPAAEWDDNVKDEEKMRRNQILLTDQDKRASEISENLVGHTVEILVEGVSSRNKTRWTGRTRANTITVFENDGTIEVGDIIKVYITRATIFTLYGEIAK